MTALALRSFEFWLLRYRRVWRGSIVTSVVTPVLYLTALGIGLGQLVNRGGNAPGGVSYLHFVAPGLLAATAMQVAASESSFPVLASIKWTRQYHAMLAAPLGVRDVLVGHQLFAAMRVGTSAVAYLAAMAAFGAVESPLAVLALPAALLVGTSFSTLVAAFAAHATNGGEFNPLFRFAIVPMFLFSGTFFPVARLPEVLQWLAYATPLWHGVALCRDLTLGRGSPAADLGHTAYLLALSSLGYVVALRAFRKRLEQ